MDTFILPVEASVIDLKEKFLPSKICIHSFFNVGISGKCSQVMFSM